MLIYRNPQELPLSDSDVVNKTAAIIHTTDRMPDSCNAEPVPASQISASVFCACPQDVPSVQIIDFHRQRYLSKFHSQQEKLLHPTLIYLSTGVLSIILSGKVLDLQEDQFILIPKGTTLEMNCGKPNSLINRVSFTINNIPFWTEHLKDYHIGRNAHVGDLFYHLNELINTHTPIIPMSPEAILCLLLEQALSTLSSNIPGQELYHAFRTYVENNISGDLSSTALSEALRYNKDYICRVVKHFSGKPVKEYIVCERLVTAKNLLSVTNEPLSRVAAAVGYESVELFSKFFRYYTHMSPLEYRRNFRKDT